MKTKTKILISILFILVLSLVISSNVQASSLTELATNFDVATNDGVTVYTLKNDLTADIVIEENEVVTIDLNGHTISSSTGDVISNYGTLTIIDNAGGGAVKATGSACKGAVVNYPGGLVKISAGTYSAESWYTVKNMGTMIIYDGTFEQTDTYSKDSSLIVNGWSLGTTNDRNVTYVEGSTSDAVLEIYGGTFTKITNTSTIKGDVYSKTYIYNGTFTSDPAVNDEKGFVIQVTGEVYVYDGTFEGTNAIACLYQRDDEICLIINGGTYSANYIISPNTTGTVEITDGIFNVEAVNKPMDNAATYTMTVTGGTYSGLSEEDVNDLLVASGYVVEYDENTGAYVVKTEATEEEPATEEETTEEEAVTEETTAESTSDSPDTGDNIIIYALILVISIIGVAVIYKNAKK